MTINATLYDVTFLSSLASKQIDLAGVTFAYLEAGTGPDLVLLHSGEFGASSETSWGRLIPRLARHHHVVAPDWLGYGGSSKIFDFENNSRRRLTHLRDGLNAIGVRSADFVGTSLGGTLLLRTLTRHSVDLGIRTATIISAGGPMPASRERAILTDYDGSREWMRDIIRVLFHDEGWASDEAFVTDRWRRSRLPGVWETAAAARLRAPADSPSSEFGRPDTFDYESIDVPVLAIGGAQDKLKPAGYLEQFVPRIHDGRSLLLQECGHCANLEHPDEVYSTLMEFIGRDHRA